MTGINRVLLGGRLTRDPELRYTPKGTAVCHFSLAINEIQGWGDEKKQKTLFVDCVAWLKQAEAVGNHLSKGRQVLVEGRLTLNSWEKNGQKISKMEVTAERVHFLDYKEAATAEPDPGQAEEWGDEPLSTLRAPI